VTRAVFLDRDGVLNRDLGFVHKEEDLEFYPDAVDALVQLSRAPCRVFIVTNQPGIGRGYYSAEDYITFERFYLQQLCDVSSGLIIIDRIYHCPHHPTEGIGSYRMQCECRKPAPGMLLQARDEFGLDLSASFLVGDKRSDIVAGKRAGCHATLVKTGYGGVGGDDDDQIRPDAIAESIGDAVDQILCAFDQ